METKIILLRFGLTLTALVSVRAVRAADGDDDSDRSGAVRVDVVVDMDSGLQATAPGNMPNFSEFSGYMNGSGGNPFTGRSNPYGSTAANGSGLDDVVQMTTQPRYFVLISAFDFQSWLHHKPVLLWRAHVSTEQWGHYFDQVVGTLINTSASLLGRETKVPHFISAATLPLGRVIVGTPEVKDFSPSVPTP